MNINIENLIEEASLARKSAYAPYSKYKVGAALITDKDKIYSGSNVENASYGLTICAERAAVFKAVNDGERIIKAIALVSSTSALPVPCGACRQVLAEFSDKLDMLVVFVNSKGKKITKNLRDLLPDAFMLK